MQNRARHTFKSKSFSTHHGEINELINIYNCRIISVWQSQTIFIMENNGMYTDKFKSIRN